MRGGSAFVWIECRGVCIGNARGSALGMYECKHCYIGECMKLNIQKQRGILNAGGSALVMYECKHCCIGNAGGSALVLNECRGVCIGSECSVAAQGK